MTYWRLIATTSEKPNAFQEKWNTDCRLEEEEIDWESAFLLARRCTRSNKLIIYLFKLLHRRLPTNSLLYKLAIKDNDRCSFCEKESETLSHYISWDCKLTTFFWNSLFSWLQTCSLTEKDLDMASVLCLKRDSSSKKLQINFCCFNLSRHYIWVCKTKCEIPNLTSILRLLKNS